jgi:hypothetical protein
MPANVAECQRHAHPPVGIIGQPVRKYGCFIYTLWRCKVLVIHYSTNGSDSACGRNSQSLSSTAQAAEVSCKSCQRSLVKPDGAAPMSVRKSPSLAELRTARQKPAGKPVQASAYCARSSWRERLSAQSDRCRLPRGMARQPHV